MRQLARHVNAVCGEDADDVERRTTQPEVVRVGISRREVDQKRQQRPRQCGDQDVRNPCFQGERPGEKSTFISTVKSIWNI